MAFCKNCGFKLGEGARFCSICSTPVTHPVHTGTVPYPPTKPVRRYTGSGGHKGLIICGIFVVLVAVLLSYGMFFDIHRSPEAVAEELVEAYYTYDAADVLDCYPEFCKLDMADRYDCGRDELVKEYGDRMEEALEDEDLEDFEVIRSRTMDTGYDIDDVYGLEDDMTPEELDKFEQWAEVTVKFKYDDKVRTCTVTCICLAGRWFALD